MRQSGAVGLLGGKHADVPITADMGHALGRLIAGEALACVIDLSELGSSAARRRFMAAFSEALYEANKEPLHLVLDEDDLWVPQQPLTGWKGQERAHPPIPSTPRRQMNRSVQQGRVASLTWMIEPWCVHTFRWLRYR
jgi:hypothetical protein